MIRTGIFTLKNELIVLRLKKLAVNLLHTPHANDACWLIVELFNLPENAKTHQAYW